MFAWAALIYWLVTVGIHGNEIELQPCMIFSWSKLVLELDFAVSCKLFGASLHYFGEFIFVLHGIVSVNKANFTG